MATTKTVSIKVTGDPSGAIRALDAVGVKATVEAEKSSGAFEKATSKIGGAFGKLDGLLAGFGVPFAGNLGILGSKMDGLEAKGSSLGSKLGSVFAGGGIAIAAVAAGIGVESIKLADAFETQQARLTTAIKNTGSSFYIYSDQVDYARKKLEALGFNNTDVTGSLATLVASTHSTQTALGQMALAADLARGRNISLEAATAILVKVNTGHVALLGRMGIATKSVTATEAELTAAHQKVTIAQETLDTAIKKHGASSIEAQKATASLGTEQAKLTKLMTQGDGATISSAEALQKLSALYGGSASANARTFHGQMQVLTARLEDVGIKIGLFLIPYVEKMAAAFGQLIAWVEAHKEDISKWLNGIGDAFVLAWQIAQPVLQQLWADIKGVWQVVSDTVTLIEDIVHGRWAAIWDDAKHLVSSVLDDIWNMFLALPLKLIDAVAGLGSDLGKSIGNGLIGVINDIIRAIDSVKWGGLDLGIFGSYGGFGGLGIPEIPKLDSGGTVTKSGIAQVTEGENWSGVGATRQWSPGDAGPLPPVHVHLMVDKRELGLVILDVNDDRARRRGTR